MTRPHVVAHRGASHDNAEHTLGAYLAALEAGADGLECDVRLTADGHLVCLHDRDLRRTANSPRRVSSTPLADLNDLDFAAWKNPWSDLDDEADGPTDSDRELRSVLTMRRLFETVAAHTEATGRRVEIAVETKHPTRYGALVERRVVELLREFGWDGADSPVRIMSFSHLALRRAQRLAPDLRYVLLVDKPRAWPALAKVMRPGWIVGPGIAMLTAHPELARRIADSGHEVHVWTVNTPEQLDTCLELGVRAVITDRPAFMLERLGV